MNKSPGFIVLFLSVLITPILISSCSDKSAQIKTVNVTHENSNATWSVIGPGGGGAQFLPHINPFDHNNVVERCDMTGAYYTKDSGKTWKMYNLRTVVRDFEFDPNIPGRVYAANTGFYRSDNGGETWRLILPAPDDIIAERMLGDHADQFFETRSGFPGSSITNIRIDPNDSRTIYLGLSAYFKRGPTDTRSGACRVLITRDEGETWSALVEIPGTQVHEIVPGSWHGLDGKVIVATDKFIAVVDENGQIVEQNSCPNDNAGYVDGARLGDKIILYALNAGETKQTWRLEELFSSTDLGESWIKIENGLNPVNAPSTQFTTIAACEENGSVAYLSISNYSAAVNGNTERQFGIVKTTDSGKTWDWVYRANYDNHIDTDFDSGWMLRDYGPEWGEYPLSLGVSPNDPDIIYATDFGTTYRSMDGGASWQQVYTNLHEDGSVSSRGLDVTTCYDLVFDPFDKNHLFIPYTDIGAFHSFNGGKSWFHAIDGIPRSWRNTCYWMIFDPEVKDLAWSCWGGAHDLPRPKMLRSGNFERYAGGTAISTDGGSSWKVSNKGLPENSVTTHIILDPKSPAGKRTLYACVFHKGVYKSTDNGESWTKAAEVPSDNKNAWRLTLMPDGRLFLLVSRDLVNRQPVDGALYVSSDGARNWEKVELPEKVNMPNDLVYNPDNPAIVYLANWPQVVDGRSVGGGILKSEDGGKTWRRVFREDAHVYALAIDPDDTDKLYFSGFDSAAFCSTDGGESWKRIRGYNFKWGHRPVIDPVNPGMIYITTFGGSIFHGPAAGDPDDIEDITNFSDSWRWGK